MSTIYTCIDELGKKGIIILNRNYTHEQIAEKLRSSPEFSEWFIKELLEKGIYLREDLTIHVHNDCTITTQQQGSSWYAYRKDKIIVHPDGGFCIIEHISWIGIILHSAWTKMQEVKAFLKKRSTSTQ